MYQFLSWFRSRKYHEIPEFDNQTFIQLIYVRDTTENLVPCDYGDNRNITEIAGLMQPPKPVLELLTGETQEVKERQHQGIAFSRTVCN